MAHMICAIVIMTMENLRNVQWYMHHVTIVQIEITQQPLDLVDPNHQKNVSPLEEVISVVVIPIIATETGNANVAFRQISKIPQVQPPNLQLPVLPCPEILQP